jgi:hypothetical protein
MKSILQAAFIATGLTRSPTLFAKKHIHFSNSMDLKMSESPSFSEYPELLGE